MCHIHRSEHWVKSLALNYYIAMYVDSQFSFKFGLVSSQAHDIKRGSE